jgi:hypothetical protein
VSVPVRAAAILVSAAVVIGLGVFVALYYIGGASSLPTVDFKAENGVTNVVLQEDPQNNSATLPDWVSYFIQDPTTKGWVHTTLFDVPAGTTVHVTIYGFDGCTPLRNNFFSRVQGTMGGTVTVSQFDQKGHEYVSNHTTSLIDSWADCNVAHTFAIPELGLYVPVASPNAQLSANNLCGTSPCTTSGNPYSLETFSFKAPDKPGVFRWQCLIPCGAGYLDGNGGPMQNLGFMVGFMNVVSNA